MMILTWKRAKRVVVFVIGMTVLLIGVAAMVLPVLQAWLIIPIGLAILATEFVWAKRLLDAVRARAQQVSNKVRGVTSAPQGGCPGEAGRTADPPPPGHSQSDENGGQPRSSTQI